MKKNILFIIGIIAGLTLGFSTALAQGGSPGQQQDRVKVYLSEPIGAGIDVHLVTRCHKTPQLATLKCNDQTATLDTVGCLTSDNKIKYNAQVQHCVEKNTDEEVARATCETDDVNHVLRYKKGNVWAVAICPNNDASNENIDKCEIQEYIAFEGNPLDAAHYKINAAGKTLRDKYGQELIYLQQFTTDGCDTREYTVGGAMLTQPTNPLLGKDGSKLPGSCEIPDEVINDCVNVNTKMVGPSIEAIGECAFTCKKAERISGKSGTDLISRYIAVVYKGMAAIVGIIAVLIMVYSGIRISMAGSQTEEIEAAKKRIFMSIAGLALLFLSGIILYAINPNFFV